MTKNLEPFIPPGTLLCPMTLRALNVRLYKIWGGHIEILETFNPMVLSSCLGLEDKVGVNDIVMYKLAHCELY
jgi:hypothetical protein